MARFWRILMFRGARHSFLSFLFLGLVFLIGTASQPLCSQTAEKGDLVGFVFEKDGKTPIEGAVLVVKNVSTGAVYRANPTDGQGLFKIDGLSRGIYSFGVTTPAGDFNGNELIGILANETTKMFVSLNPYEGQVQSAVLGVLREQQEREGEARVGRVIGYNPNTREAEVFIEKGLLQLDDNIRVRGRSTDFYQDVKAMKIGGAAVKRALAGQNVMVKLVQAADLGDIVYVVCKRGVVPIFWVPLGAAIASLATLTVIELTEKECVSPYKKK
jgi:hypothetical protein